jgi:hypothetical protein
MKYSILHALAWRYFQEAARRSNAWGNTHYDGCDQGILPYQQGEVSDVGRTRRTCVTEAQDRDPPGIEPRASPKSPYRPTDLAIPEPLTCSKIDFVDATEQAKSSNSTPLNPAYANNAAWARANVCSILLKLYCGRIQSCSSSIKMSSPGSSIACSMTLLLLQAMYHSFSVFVAWILVRTYFL